LQFSITLPDVLPDCECLTNNNRSDSDLQFALPKARSNSGAKIIKHSAIEIWSRIFSEVKNKTCLALFSESIMNMYNSVVLLIGVHKLSGLI